MVMAQALEDMGIPGKTFLQEALTNTTDPLGAIEDFQRENSILLISLQPALPFLDLHDLKRLDFHNSVFEVLRDCLLNKIEKIAKNGDSGATATLEAILEKSFPLNKIDSLLPVSMSLLKHLPKVSERYLSALTKDKHLYKACPIEVKRQIWQKNQTMFGDEVLPLLTQYVKDKEAILLSDCSLAKNFFTSSPKSRRQTHVVKTLTEMIGKNIRLYDMVLQFLRTLFLRTHNIHYCSLRAEILMSLHDLEISDVCSVDPCYKFTWCLDACIREHFVDAKRARELQGFLDSVRKGHEQVLGDLSMILCDPFAVNTMLWSVLKIIQESTFKETLPRDNGELPLLIRMLTLGQAAWDIINKQVFKEPKIDQDIITRLIPTLISVGVHDHITTIKNKMKAVKQKSDDTNSESIVEIKVPRHENVVEVKGAKEAKADKEKGSKKKSKGKKVQEKSSASTDIDGMTQLKECILKYSSKDHLSRLLVMWYLFQLIKAKRKSLLIELIPVLGKSYKDCSIDSVFVHALSAHLCSHSDLLTDDNLCLVLFNKLLIVSKSLKEVQHKQLLLLVTSVYSKLPSERLKALTSRLEPKPKKASEQVVQLYAKLKGKLEQVEANSSTQDTPLSPDHTNLLGVPTPAAL